MTIKLEGNYNDKEFTYPGPAHLAVRRGSDRCRRGLFMLGVRTTLIFGSHRSHHEVIAKGLSAIKKLPDEKLIEIMKGCSATARSPTA